jgi:hypothetical protein
LWFAEPEELSSCSSGKLFFTWTQDHGDADEIRKVLRTVVQSRKGKEGWSPRRPKKERILQKEPVWKRRLHIKSSLAPEQATLSHRDR